MCRSIPARLVLLPIAVPRRYARADRVAPNPGIQSRAHTHTHARARRRVDSFFVFIEGETRGYSLALRRQRIRRNTPRGRAGLSRAYHAEARVIGREQRRHLMGAGKH